MGHEWGTSGARAVGGAAGGEERRAAPRTAAAAHDIRHPINAALMGVELARRHFEDLAEALVQGRPTEREMERLRTSLETLYVNPMRRAPSSRLDEVPLSDALNRVAGGLSDPHGSA